MVSGKKTSLNASNKFHANQWTGFYTSVTLACHGLKIFKSLFNSSENNIKASDKFIQFLIYSNETCMYYLDQPFYAVEVFNEGLTRNELYHLHIETSQ